MKLQRAEFDLKIRSCFRAMIVTSVREIMKKCLLALEGCFNGIVYIGDAEWDVQAAETLGWHFIGVGARLEGKCEFWVEDFSNQNLFMRMLQTY